MINETNQKIDQINSTIHDSEIAGIIFENIIKDDTIEEYVTALLAIKDALNNKKRF